MKQINRTFIFVLVLTALLVSACAGAASPASNSGGGKAQAGVVEFTGVIQAINGNQWTINDQVVTVDPAVIRDGPFQVGDTVKLEAEVAQDGSVMVTRVETPSATVDGNGNGNEGLADNSNSNVNGGANSNSNANTNDSSVVVSPTTGKIVFDNGGSEAFGPVDSITADTVVVGGQAFALTNGSEFKDLVQAGDFVKVHFVLNADGTYSIVEIENWDPAFVSDGNSNSNDNNNNNTNSNTNSNGNNNSDDNNSNGSDDNDSNGSDDNNGNGNDDNGGDDDNNGNGDDSGKDDDNNSNANGNG